MKNQNLNAHYLFWILTPFLAVLVWACGDDDPLSPADKAKKAQAESPKTIEDVIKSINAMSKPVTLVKYLESLPHPLTIDATSSTSSLQPAKGPNNPRIFIISQASSSTPLFMSIQLEGDQSHALEFGQVLSGGKHQLGNIEFPVTSTLSSSNVMRSSCGTGGCHDFGEYVQPDPSRRVDVSTVSRINSDCTGSSTRCDMLHALFKESAPSSYLFPSSFK